MAGSLGAKITGITLASGLLAVLIASADATPSPEARTSDSGGVKVVITPRTAEPGATAWEFRVVLDTHSKPLSEDIARASVLVDDAGRRFPALAWEGDPPGGHHREGVLRFAAPQPPPQLIELRMESVGGTDMRTFRWSLK